MSIVYLDHSLQNLQTQIYWFICAFILFIRLFIFWLNLLVFQENEGPSFAVDVSLCDDVWVGVRLQEGNYIKWLF